jgi:hypothetical protein
MYTGQYYSFHSKCREQTCARFGLVIMEINQKICHHPSHELWGRSSIQKNKRTLLGFS